MICKCSRCKFATRDENRMVAHILDKVCEKNAQYYTRVKEDGED